jgi:hypothetical protein
MARKRTVFGKDMENCTSFYLKFEIGLKMFHTCKELCTDCWKSGWKFKMMNRMWRHLVKNFQENYQSTNLF